MARTFIRQDTQVRNSDVYDDTVAAGSTLESAPAHIEDDLNALRSQAKRAIWQDSAGNWYDDIPTINSKKRGIRDLNFDLNDIEEKKMLCRAQLLTDITVPNTQNWKILVVASSETPTQVAAVALTQNGAVVAQSALSGAGFDVHELIEIAGANAISPKNLALVRNATTGQPVQSSGRDVFGLLQYESTGTDGAAFNDTSAGNRVKISFVRLNAGLDDLEACPVADIQNAVINYSYVFRTNLDAVAEECFLANGTFTDLTASVDVTRQNAYNNQGTTPVDLTTNATLDLEGAGLVWAIRDDLEANLFRIIEGSAGGTSQVSIDGDVDTFNVDAVVNDFASGIRTATGTTRIDVGVTAGTIETTGAADLRVLGAGELYLDDGNQSGSTWAQTNGIKLSDTTAEWDLFETNYGEVSLLNAINQAYNVGARGTKVYANVTANTSADNDVGGVAGGTNLDTQLPNLSAGTFLTDYDLFFNGELLRPGADASANNDYYPGTSLANGQVRFEFNVKTGDVICVIPYA